MENNTALSRIKNLDNYPSITGLLWIPTCNHFSIRDFLFELQMEAAFNKTIDAVLISKKLSNSKINKFFESLEDDLCYDFKKLFTDNGLTGFMAEIIIPNCYGFIINDGKASDWRVNEDCGSLHFVYADTLEQLVEQIETLSKKTFTSDLAKHLSK